MYRAAIACPFLLRYPVLFGFWFSLAATGLLPLLQLPERIWWGRELSQSSLGRYVSCRSAGFFTHIAGRYDIPNRQSTHVRDRAIPTVYPHFLSQSQIALLLFPLQCPESLLRFHTPAFATYPFFRFAIRQYLSPTG